MHFTLLALSAVAAVAIPLDPAGGKVGAARMPYPIPTTRRRYTNNLL